MSTAIKNTRLSSEDKTAEFELPDFSKKGTIVPPTPAVQQKVQSLRTENQQLKQEIEQVKTETVRKVDEPTRIFNLRQAQMLQKLKDLEIKKLATQKAIQKMIEEKNTTLHEDLSKATASLVMESQKFAPLEKELTEGMLKLTSLRNELQNNLEQTSADRKKSSQTLIEQGVEITNLKTMIQQCHDLMAKEYAQLSNALRPLIDEKVEMEKSVLQLKSESGKFETEIKLMETKKFNLELTLAEVDRKIETHKNLETEQGAYLVTVHARIETAKRELEAFQAKHFELEKIKERDLQEIEALREEHALVEKGGETVKWSLVTLNEQCEQKKKSVAHLDQEMMDLKKRIEDLRTMEADLIKTTALHSVTFHQLKGEVSSLEAGRAAAFKLQEEALAVLTERRAFYQQHVQDLEYTHKLKMAQLEKDYQDQKSDWDKNFQALEEAQRKALEAKLEEQTVKHHTLLRDTQSVLMDDMVKVVKRHLTRTVFESGQQRAEAAQEELEPLLKNYFHQTANLSNGKPWHNWRYWMWATSTSAVVSLGLIAKMIWFK